jgi:uncharacterized protein YhfF
VPSVSAVLAALSTRGIELPPGRVTLDTYGDSPELSQALLALIRSGAKRAGTSLLWGIEADGDPMPADGDIVVVLDHRHEPSLLVRVTEAYVTPFRDVTAAYAEIEGEGDRSLEDWCRGHWAFFSRECHRLGREPSEDMPVVCCVFEVIRDLLG